MATISKNFRVKNGLIVEGTTATVNGSDVLTKKQDDQDYIVGLIGGTAASTNTPDTVVKRDGTGSFAAGTVTADLVGNVTGNASTATTLETSRTISVSGDATGSVSFDGSGDADIAITLDASFATDTEVATAKSEAIADAATYTDGRETAITTAYQSYADQSELDAVSTAATDATSKANAAQAAAEATASADATSKANAAQAAAEATASADATSKANAAQAAAEATASADATSKANAAEANAESYADSLIGDGTVDGTGGNTVTDRIASAVANLVDSSPAALDTLNELAAALGDDPNFATTVASDIGTKVSKAGDTMTGDLSLAQDPTENLHAATKQYVDAAESDAVVSANSYTDGRETAITTAYQSYADTAEADAISTASADATSKANAAQSAAEATASADATAKADAAELAATTAAALDATTKANTAEGNANSYTDGQIANVNATIGALDTDDIPEGATNEYFTTERAQDAVAAAIAAGTHANITITYDDNAGSISFEAENGVADSDTDDLVEGTSNLYFTDQRAVDALQAVVPVFTEVDVNSLSKIVATTVDVATQNTTGVVASFDSGTYTSAKFVVKADIGTHTEVTEVLLTLDSSLNIAITEYANVNTGGNLMDVTAVMNGTTVELQATVVNDNTTVRATGTLIA
jgi:hypothetical protein